MVGPNDRAHIQIMLQVLQVRPAPTAHITALRLHIVAATGGIVVISPVKRVII